MELTDYKTIHIGGYCTIYSVFDAKEKKRLTLRIINNEITSSPSFKKHFDHVTSFLLNRSIGNNVVIRHAESSKQQYKVVTDLFEGLPPLQQQGVQQTLSIHDTITIGIKLANSLSLLHNMGVLHGGVGRTNISLSGSDDVTLGMFALHRTMPGEEGLFYAPVTLDEAHYRAPEANIFGVSPATDFYALGVFLYELCVGHRLYKADSITALHDQQEMGQLSIPDSAADLQPLFERLLTPNTLYRISSAAEFYAVLIEHQLMTESQLALAHQLMSELTLSQRTKAPKEIEIETSTNAAIHNSDLFIYEPQHTSRLRPILLGLLLVSSTVAGYIYYDPSLLRMAEEWNPIHININHTSDTAAVASPAASPVMEPTHADTPAEMVNQLLQQASDYVVAQRYALALTTVNSALQQIPDHTAATTLRAEIEQQIEIDNLFKRAKEQSDSIQLITPAGDNALATYRLLQQRLGKEDPRITAAIQEIADYFLAEGELQLRGDHLRAALTSAQNGLVVLPTHEPLLTLKNRIQYQQSQLEQEQEQQQIQQQQQQQLTMQQQQLQEQLQEQQRLLAEQKQLFRAQQRAEQQRQQKTKQRSSKEETPTQTTTNQPLTTQFIATAQSLLQTSPLTIGELSSAETIYDTLSRVTPDDERVTTLFSDISRSYNQLSTRQFADNHFNESLITIEQGLNFNTNNKALARLKVLVTRSINRAQQADALPQPQPSSTPLSSSDATPFFATF